MAYKNKPRGKKQKPNPQTAPTPTPEETRKASEPAPPPPETPDPPSLQDNNKDKNPLNFELTPKGVLPAGINQKSFYALHLGPQETINLKTGQILKCTAGKVRVRNINQKGFIAENSMEKGDVLKVLGPAVVFNADKEENAHFRVFTIDLK